MRHPSHIRVPLRTIVSVAASIATAAAARTANAQVADPHPCDACAAWNAPQAPVRLHANTYYVGPHGLAVLLITSPQGHVLIDGAIDESAPAILRNIEALGFQPRDIKVILSSHVHYDHVGSFAELQRVTGAVVMARPWSATVLRRGASDSTDPQFGILRPMLPVQNVRELKPGEVVRVGPLALRALETGGHTPGGTSWSWRSCDAQGVCRDFVYADSQSPISADGFSYARSATYPAAVQDFRAGWAAIEQARCDILITPHPDASSLWERVSRLPTEGVSALTDENACLGYVAMARARLADRLARDTTPR